MWGLIGLLAAMASVVWLTMPWPENLWGIGMIGLVGGILLMARWIGRDGEERDRWDEANREALKHRRSRRQ